MLPQHLALVSTVDGFDSSELTEVSAALQKQATRDLGPIWGIEATIDVFSRFEDVPVGYWPVVLVEDSPQPGLHKDYNGHPIAYVVAGKTWSLAASHEVLEMLVDPWGYRTVPGQSPEDATQRVEFLVEVCDPCQAPDNAYSVNGILVSDFCTPAYFDPISAPSVRYTFRGKASGPHEVLLGGYLSWNEPASGHWKQMKNDGGILSVRDLGPLSAGPLALRTMIDSMTKGKQDLSRVSKTHPQVMAVSFASEERRRTGMQRAEQWRKLTNAVCSRPTAQKTRRNKS